MKHNTDRVLAWIGLSEGGYVNHPRDPGGATDRGITQRTYDAWNRQHGRKTKPVRGISKTEAEDILVAQYLTPVKFNDLPDGLDYAVADWSVNSGPARAAKELQKLIGVTADGIIGSQTLAAVDRQNITALIHKYCDRRLAFLKSLKTWPTFGKGWSTRVSQVRSRAAQMASGGAVVSKFANLPGEAQVKADEADRSEASWVKKTLDEPSIWLPVVGGVASGAVEGDGPMQWAIAAVIVMGALFAGVRLLKRSV